MSEYLDRWLPDLTGAEFKIASYLCRQLEKQEVVSTTITALSRATGVSWRQTQTCLQSLAKQGVLLVHSRKGQGTQCRLPVATPTPSETVSPSQHGADKIESVPAGAASDAEVEARQLAAELLGRPVDDGIMAELQAGVDRHAHHPGALHGPGALLRRLRVAKKWGKASQDVAAMATILEELYWI
jgi:hypothetical protein